jgi:bifunctional non-homologous end joining protein LigD
MALVTYRRKRDFHRTPEPRGETKPARRGRAKGLLYVIQKHAASRLHYDFRLEWEGVLKSWAVPKGPSLNPSDKRLAVEVEDHPVEYGNFEGTIPAGEYGGGTVLLWDRGTWEPVGDPDEGLRRGRFSFVLHGEKLVGKWLMVRMRSRENGGDKNWLLMKEKDPSSRPTRSRDVLEERPESVKSGRTIEEIGGKGDKIWSSGRPATRRSRRPRGATAPAAAVQTKPTKPAPARKGGAKLRAEARAAPKGPLPDKPTPELATLVSAAPDGDRWLHEIKFDGYRALCRISRGEGRLLTRTGQDWTDRFLTVADEALRLPVKEALLDGEIVILEPDGRTSFQALQNALRRRRDQDLIYFVFDLLYLDGRDFRSLPLESRKEALRELLEEAGELSAVRYSDHVIGQGKVFHAEACQRGLEGIVSKRRDAPYRSGRGSDWLKVKCAARQEFVIGGFTEPKGARSGLGALLLGVREKSALRYCGRVGTGFTHDLLRDLRQKLGRLERDQSPFENPPSRGRNGIHWVKPELVAEVAFTGWTDDRMLRHPSFQGLREDKPASETVLERPLPTREVVEGRSGRRERRLAPKPGEGRRPPPKPSRKSPPKRDPERKAPVREPPVEEPTHPPVREPPGEGMEVGGKIRGITITNPQRVLYPDQGITKLDLARYMEAASERMLPEVAGRPLMLRRCPEGIAKPCFIQKHPGGAPAHPAVGTVRVRESGGPTDYLSVEDGSGLVALVQMGALEVHVWGARGDRDDRPDRIVIDLDPDPAVPWKETVATALRFRERLQELGLVSYAKTTGGKGIHVVIPIRRGPGWDEIKSFTDGLALEFVHESPDRFTTQLSKSRRGGKILLDTLRNRRGATWVAPYSARAKDGAPVSAPLDWSEVTPKLQPEKLNIRTMPKRLTDSSDPWEGVLQTRQTITARMIQSLSPRRSAPRSL